MKFAEHLGAHITPEWRKQYIQYEEMKAMLDDFMASLPDPAAVDSEVINRSRTDYEEHFFSYCEHELTKINTFYAEKLAEAQRKFASLKSELESASTSVASDSADRHAGGIFSGLRRRKRTETNSVAANVDKVPARKLNDLKLAYSEYYLSLVLLQNYQSLNFTGFRKILKKHDKNLKTESGGKWHQDHVVPALFHNNRTIDKLISETESCFINQLEAGDRQRAMKRLRVPPLNDKHSPWTTFKVGLFLGAFSVLISAVILSVMYYRIGSHLPLESKLNDKINQVSEETSSVSKTGDSRRTIDWLIAFRLYRGPLLLIIYLFLLGLNVYGWRSSGVNHVLIFELDPRNHLSEQHLMEVAATLGVIWTLSVLMFIYSDFLSIPAFVNPLALIIIILAIMFNPLKMFRYDARIWMLRVLGRILTAPFHHVGFADFWVADQLNSLVIVLTDIFYFFMFYAFYSSNLEDSWNSTRQSLVASDDPIDGSIGFWLVPFVRCVPAWCRFAQCLRRYRDTRDIFPHVVNAGKYSTTLFVVFFTTVHLAFAGFESGIAYNVSIVTYYAAIIASFISSTYSYIWDIKMDWGLMDKSATADNCLLREEIVYQSSRLYYFAIVEDFLLRFSWTVVAQLKKTAATGGIANDVIVTVVGALEAFRRFVWNFFRLENEHLNNCGQFRAVRDISVAPIKTSDQDLLIRMMEEPDGIMNVRRQQRRKMMASSVVNGASSPPFESGRTHFRRNPQHIQQPQQDNDLTIDTSDMDNTIRSRKSLILTAMHSATANQLSTGLQKSLDRTAPIHV